MAVRNKGFIAVLICPYTKGNQWLIGPDQKAGYFYLISREGVTLGGIPLDSLLNIWTLDPIVFLVSWPKRWLRQV